MLRLFTLCTAVCLLAQTAQAQDKLAAKFEALTREYDKAQDDYEAAMKKRQAEFRKASEAAESAEERAALAKKFQEDMPEAPGAKFAVRFYALAEGSPKDPQAVQAIAAALRAGGPALEKSGLRAKILANLRANYLTSPDIKLVLRQALMFGDDQADQFVRDLIAKNPDRILQARAVKNLAQNMRAVADAGERMEKSQAMKKNVESRFGKEFVERVIANADKWAKQAEEWSDIFKQKYADVIPPPPSVGKEVPELVMQDVSGKEVKLSALKGKVVVLDVWATWCGPCRAMIPHERDMVDRLKDKPFVLVSISADARKKTLTDFLAKEAMPWTHWWNGEEGGILEDWDINSFPTIYVIDDKGVVRFKNLRGEALEDAVNELLKEMQGKGG